MVKRNVAAGRLRFTTDVAESAKHGVIQFIAVGTPPDEDGSADLQYVVAAARAIGQNMEEYKVIVDKSTVPVGTQGFEIERSTTGIGGTYSILTTVSANTTMYLDQNLFPQAEYCYQVRAIKPGGSSAYTNANCATTNFEPAVATLTFQEGVNGYSGTVDTYIWSAPTEVNSSFGGNEEVQWDGSDLPPGQTVAGEQDAIIRFENIFGTGTGQIPPTAVIQSATLTYTVFDMGNEANVYNVLVNNWSEATSWNTFGLNPGIQAEDYNSTQVATGPPGP